MRGSYALRCLFVLMLSLQVLFALPFVFALAKGLVFLLPEPPHHDRLEHIRLFSERAWAVCLRLVCGIAHVAVGGVCFGTKIQTTQGISWMDVTDDHPRGRGGIAVPPRTIFHISDERMNCSP